MGEVYTARDTRLDRTVAIKMLRAHLGDDPQRRARFEREARLISQLNHPHIRALYDVGHDAGTDYIVIEYLEGQTLSERLQKGPLPLAQALEAAIQVASALDAAHRKGIVHRDVKPANVMQTRYGAKLLDFGIACLTMAVTDGEPTAAATLTAAGTVLGTVHYMAPEVLEGRDADTRSDLFAFGATLYEMLTGRRAFAGESRAKVAAAVLESEPPPIATTERPTPPALEHLVTTCLAKNPDDRWQTASDVKRQLEWIAASGLPAAQPTMNGAYSGHKTGLPRKPAMIASLVALVVGSGLVWALWPRPPAAAVVVRETRLEISTPPTTPSRQASVAISPDGLTVAFVADAEGRSVLWLRPLSGAARSLDGTVGAALPFWSPDSQSLGFFADGKLKRIEVKGGAAQILADALDPQGGTWSRDGTIIFTPHQLSPLVRVAAAGGATAPVTRLAAGQVGHLDPQVLPDGAHVLYFATGGPDVQGVYVSRLDGTAPKRLLEKTSPAVHLAPGYLLFVREDVLLAQALDLARLELTGDPISIADRVAVIGSSSAQAPVASASTHGDIVYRMVPAGSAREVMWLDRSGRAVRSVGSPDNARREGLVSLSADNHWVAINRQLGDASDLWLLDLERSGVMSRLTFGGKESWPLWSRDGLQVAFASTRNGVLDLYEASVDGGHDRPLLVTSENKVPAAWSPDGRVLLYLNADSNQDLTRNTHLDIWALPIGSGEKPFALVRSLYEDLNPQFGPDGTWLVYQSNVSNRYEVYVRPFPDPGPPVPISTAGATQPRLRRDGRELFYVGLDHWMMAVPIAVAANGRSVNTGTPVRLFKTTIGGPESGALQREYAVSPDGQRFLFDMPVEQSSPPLILIQNWRP